MKSITNRDWSFVFVLAALACWLFSALTLATPYFSRDAQQVWVSVFQGGMLVCMVIATYLLILAARDREFGVGALAIIYCFARVGVGYWFWLLSIARSLAG